MRWPEPLIRGRLVRRYKRFLVDVALTAGKDEEASFRVADLEGDAAPDGIDRRRRQD
jgi:hypothetical protein